MKEYLKKGDSNMKQTTRLRSITVSIFACSLLASCASVPPDNPKLDQAYSDYNAASQDNTIQQAAPEQLQKASTALAKADDLLKKGAPASDVEHYAYLARKRVAIAKQKAEADVIQQKIKQSGAQRDKLMLEAKQEKINQLREQLSRLKSLKAKKTDRGLVLTLGSVLFDLNKSTLKPGAMKSVEKLSEFMKNDPKRNVMIEGYTDSTGSPEYNKRLSRRRAESVRDALVTDGINPQRIVTKGYGADYAVASNKTAAGRQENRRVEIVISDQNGSFPKSR